MMKLRKGENKNAPYLIELLADMVQKPALNKSSIAVERHVINAEYDGEWNTLVSLVKLY